MNTFLHKLKHSFIVLLFVFCGKMSAQCTITGSVLSSTQTCSSFSTCPIINIGDGVNPTTLILDKNLDLTTCSLGAVQIIVNSNSNIDFSDQNYDLRLPAGSSITFNGTGTLISPGGCSGSDRIIVGGNVIATCLGSGPPSSFSELVAQGGYSSINAAASPTSVCGSGSFALTATANPSTGATYNWYFSESGGVSVHTGATYNTGIISSTTTYYVAASYTSPSTYTTVRKAVTATVKSLPVAAGTIAGTTTVCQGQSSVGYSVPAITNATSYTWAYSGTGATITSTTNTPAITFAANATSGNLTVYGVNTCGNGAISANYAITVSPNLPASVSIAASKSGAICSGTSVTFTATPINGGVTPVYQWKLNGVDVGLNSATYTNSDLANGDNVTCVMTSNATPCRTGSPATSNVVTMTVESGVPVATVLTDIVLACNQTATTATWAAVANVTEYRFDLSLDPLFGTFAGYQDVSIAPSATPSVAVNGLTPGAAYYARVRTVSSCGTSVQSNTAIFSVPIIKSADGGATWDNVVLDGTQRAIFTASATMSAAVSACSCQINPNVDLVVGTPGGLNNTDTAILKLENGLDVVGSGTLTFENNASLIQVNDAAINTGVIIYKRTAKPMKNFDFTYWSSPVVGQELGKLSPNTLSDKYFSFGNNAWKTESVTNTMDIGKGYIIRVPNPNFWPIPTNPTYAQSVQFKGKPNNGIKTLAIGLNNGDANLIGNPYPSAMSADAFLATNNKELDGTIYFWTHNTAISNLTYSSSDYASYNGVGGVNTLPAGSGGAAPSGNIAAGQSFFTVTKRAAGFIGKVTFNNSMRVGVANKNAQFFKGTNFKEATIVKHRVWLNLTNTEGAFKQTLVGYVTGATLGNDTAFDGESFDGNTFIDFYSINESKNLVIQGRALPFDKSDKVLLGYKTTVKGTFAISIDKVDGVLENQTIFIEDKVTNVIHNLKNGPYSFTTGIGVFNDRFVLRYTDNSVVVVDPVVTTPVVTDPIGLDSNKGGGALGTDSFENKGRAVIVSVKDHQIKINSFDEIIGKVMVYDLRGRLLYQNKQVNKNEFVIYNLNSSDQFLIVLTQLINGTWVSQEIIFKH